MKEFNNNISMQNYPNLNQHQKGRKLIEDFNKFPKNNESDNENPINNNNNNPINDNKPSNIDKNGNTNYNISFNNFSFLTPSNRPLKDKEKEKEKEYDENQKESEAKNNIIKTTNNKIIIDNSYSNDINNNNTINTNANSNHNMFFTDYGLGYKCNCQKTQCNKFYCQCYNQGRYCFNCNCIDCNNKKPESVPTNKHQTEEDAKDKKVITISCTCTKSGCNKNYCECFKSKVKCTELCRCRNCENCEIGKNCKKRFSGESNSNNYFELECCPANSVFIVKNEIVFEDVDKYKNKVNKKNDPIRREIRLTINDNLLNSFSSEENQSIGHKRKRFNMKNDKNTSEKKSNSKLSEETENTNDKTKIKSKNYIEGGLFDKNGKLILTNFNI